MPFRTAILLILAWLLFGPSPLSADTKAGKLEKSHKNIGTLLQPRITQVAFSRQSPLVATSSFLGTLKVWNTEEWKEVKSFNPARSLSCVVFSPDGKWLVAGGTDFLGVWSVDEWTLTRPDIRLTKSGIAMSPECVSFTPDGEFLFAGGHIGDVVAWKTGSWERVKTGVVHRRPAGAPKSRPPVVDLLAFHPGGEILLTGGRTESIRFWKQTKKGRWKNVGSFREAPSQFLLKDACFSPRGEFAAVAGAGRLQIFATEERLKKLHDIKVQPGPQVNGVMFGPGGQRVYTVGAAFQVWDPRSGKLQREFEIEAFGHDLALSPEGDALILVFEDVARVYELK